MNVNTTASMTENMRASAAAVARPDNEIIAAEPRFGSPSVEGYFDSYLSAVGRPRPAGDVGRPDLRRRRVGRLR